MKIKSRNLLIVFLMAFALMLGVFGLTPLTANAASSVRVDFCLTNGALENDVFFENDSSKYFLTQNTKNDGKLTYLEELYRTDDLDLEFDGWYTEQGEKVTTETVFTEYTILYDRWKETTLTAEDIISTLQMDTPLLKVGETAGTYDVNSVILTDNRLTVANVSVYEGLNAYRTNKLDNADILEMGKSYSLRIELHTNNGELIDNELFSHSTATYGLVANMVYSHDNSGIFTTQWTNRENKIQVIVNYDYENYYFTYNFEDKVVENNQSPQYTIYVSKMEQMASAKLYVLGAGGTWSSLGEVSGQFNVPANSNVIKQYRVEVTYQNGFVISSNTFKVDWYDPNSPKFITQPTDYNIAYGTNVLVTWGLNFDVSSIQLERYMGESWNYVKIATPTGVTIDAYPESGTYTFRVHATKDGTDYYSEEFTVTWREKFEFTTQPQSMTVATGESYTITWETNHTPSMLQVWGDDGTGNYSRFFSINDTSATSYTFDASSFAYSQNYKIMVNYDSTVYYSDIFTIDIVAGEFTMQPQSVNAIVGKEILIEWDFNLEVAYYDILWYDGNDFTQYERVEQPEHAFIENSVGRMQFMIEAYNENNIEIGQSELFEITWTEQQIVYLVSFNANGGTGTMQPVEQNAGSQYTLPTCTFTSPQGQIFKCWSVNEEEKNVGDKIAINANTVIKAIWEDNEVIYAYAPNGADGSLDMDYITVGEEITLANCMFTAPDGKQFKAWAIGSLQGEQKQPGEKITITEETYIYAIWEDIPHSCVGVLQSGQGATCTVDGWKDYYQCACSKLYEDENCTIPINDLSAWKVGNGKIVATHSGTAEWIKTATTHAKKYTCCDTFVVEQEQHEWNNGACSECGYNCQHSNISVTKKDGKGATCIVDGWKDYYQCACGKFFADENRTMPIDNLETWKVNDGKILAKHEYGDLIPEESAVHTQTELKAGLKAHYYCSVCETYFDENKVETTLLALTIVKPEHVYGDYITSDSDKHWKQCTCGLKSELGDHVYTDELDTDCNTCGHIRNSVHTCGNGVKQDGKSATCTENGWKDYYKCICNKLYADADCTIEITALEDWKNSDGKILAKHEYGDLIEQVNATCSATGKQAHYHCSVCGTFFNANKEVKTENELTIAIDVNAHNFGAWTSNGNGTHTRVCSLNGEHTETADCSGGTATCTEKAVCEYCNTAYGDTAQHNHGTAWENNADEHWNECSCGDKANIGGHVDENANGKCDVCDYQMTNGGGTSEQPENPENPNDGLSTGAIVGIVVGGVVAVGFGGFALVWFVIKKKSLADLLAIFKKK